MTPAEYLEAERRAQTKSEYYAGEVFAMARASEPHNLIVANVIGSLWALLRGGPCRVYPSDLRVKLEAGGLYTYPDVSVVCGTAELEDEQLDTLLNPIVLIEVLSDSTERYDRGLKAELYRRVPSLQEHVLIVQGKLQVERYRRQAERDWLLTEFRGLDESVELTSINCTLALRDIYDGITLPAHEAPHGIPDSRA